MNDLLLGDSRPSGDIIRPAMLYIREHIRDPRLSLETIAFAINVPASSLAFAFRSAKQTTVEEIITRQRVTLAKGMLILSKMKVQDIAHALGMDESQFSAFFQQHVRTSPTQFRKSSQGKKVDDAWKDWMEL